MSYFNGKIHVSLPVTEKEIGFILSDIFEYDKSLFFDDDRILFTDNGDIEFIEYKYNKSHSADVTVFTESLNKMTRFLSVSGKCIVPDYDNLICADNGTNCKYISFDAEKETFTLLGETEQTLIEAPDNLLLKEMERRGFYVGHIVTDIVWDTHGEGWTASRNLPSEVIVPASVNITDEDAVSKYLEDLSDGVCVKEFCRN